MQNAKGKTGNLFPPFCLLHFAFCVLHFDFPALPAKGSLLACGWAAP
jgi:hypothetical protein